MKSKQRTVGPAASRARVFDSFVRHQPNMGGARKAKALADALETFKTGITPALREKQEEARQAEIKKGIVAAQTGILEDGKRIREGELEPDQSRWFMQGYRIEKGRGAGLQFEQHLWNEYENSGLRNSDDPGAISQFYQDRLGAYLLANPVADANGQRGLAEVLPGVSRNFSTMAGQKMRESIRENVKNELAGKINHRFIAYRAGGDVEALKQATISSVQEAYNIDGLKGDIAKGIAWDQWKQEAERRIEAGEMDMPISQWIDSYPDELRNADVLSDMQSTKRKLASATFERVKREQFLRDESLDQAEDDIARKALANPGYVYTEAFTQDMARLGTADPDRVSRVKETIQGNNAPLITITPQQEAQNFERVVDAMRDAHAMGDAEEVLRIKSYAKSMGLIQTPGAYAALAEEHDTLRKTGGFLSHPVVKNAENLAFSMFGEGSQFMTKLDPTRLAAIERQARIMWRDGAVAIGLKGTQENPSGQFSAYLVQDQIHKLADLVSAWILNQGGGGGAMERVYGEVSQTPLGASESPRETAVARLLPDTTAVPQGAPEPSMESESPHKIMLPEVTIKPPRDNGVNPRAKNDAWGKLMDIVDDDEE